MKIKVPCAMAGIPSRCHQRRDKGLEPTIRDIFAHPHGIPRERECKLMAKVNSPVWKPVDSGSPLNKNLQQFIHIFFGDGSYCRPSKLI